MISIININQIKTNIYDLALSNLDKSSNIVMKLLSQKNDLHKNYDLY